LLPLEFVVMGTPLSRYASGDAKRFWIKRARAAAEMAVGPDHEPTLDAVVVRVAYFYMDDVRTADLDNIVKPLLDVMRKLVYRDDPQVIDLVASMRPKEVPDRVLMSPTLFEAFQNNSSFVWVFVDRTSSLEVFRDLG
jgi:hypothetical protein